jgi:lysophospholipase L1-like esterase
MIASRMSRRLQVLIGTKVTSFINTTTAGKRSKRGCNNNNVESGDGGGGGGVKFSWTQVFLQWGVGVYVSIPLIAILQGTFLLNDYRVNYSDAPVPVSPARGVAVAIDDDDDNDDENNESKNGGIFLSWILHPFSSVSSSNHQHHHQNQNQKPLRLLVVGDSLAAGVGISKSGVPILPESIARALSKELGGRAVYWTCVGTPGVSAAQIVKDIDNIEPYDPHPKGRQLERIVKEFQTRRRRWQHRHDHIDDEDGNSNSNSNSNSNNNPEVYIEKPKNAIIEWWKQIRQNESFNSDEIRNTTRRVVSDWWMQVRNGFRHRKELVEEDISAIKEIYLKPLPILDDDDDDYYYDYYRENLLRVAEDESRSDKKDRFPLVRKGTLFRRTSVNPDAVSEYDVAVVLTGLNDVKEAFMPHMNSGSQNATSLESSLRQVLEALRDKMGEMDLEKDNNNNNNNNNNNDNRNSIRDPSTTKQETLHTKNIRHPLVVVPELPVAPLQIFKLVPLCWFLVPIFRAMENNKRFLASSFPDYVVFVHQPDLCWWTDTEMGIGSIRENIEQEQLLLRVTDSAKSVRERIEQLMKKYYDAKEEEIESPTSTIHENKNDNDIYDIDDENCILHNTESSFYSNKNSKGSDLVSVDRLHPNDEGYELWGRHIAAAIIEHWNKSSNNNNNQ